MKTYETTSKDVAYIPISQIEFTDDMVKSLYSTDNESKQTYDIIIKDREESYPLSRLNSVIDAIQTNKKLPKIDVQIHESIVSNHKIAWVPKSKRTQEYEEILAKIKTKVEKKISYSVINGRHRCVASLICGLTHIPAEVSK